MAKLTSEQLCTALGVESDLVSQWIRAGMPVASGRGKSRRFDPAAVKEWLIEHGVAEAPPTIVPSLRDVAAHFGVSERAVRYWVDHGMPGRVGEYNVDQIRLWRNGRTSAAGDDAGIAARAHYETELARLKVEEQQIRVNALAGKMIDVDMPERVFSRILFEARAQGDQAADRALGALDPDLAAQVGASVREVILATMDNIFATLARGMDEYAEELRELMEEQERKA